MMALAYGSCFHGTETPDQVRQMAQVAEAEGIETLWFACHMFQREPIALATMALGSTTRIKLALMAMSPYLIHPVYLAMVAATLDEMFPGRVVLSVGVGGPRDLDQLGVAYPRPLATLEEAIALIRDLFRGETVEFKGERFNVTGRRLITGECTVPIVLAASGPQMLKLAGRVADGVLISAATSVEFVRWCLDRVAEGEEAAGRKVKNYGIVYAAASEKRKDAYDHLRRTLAFVLRGAHHARNLELAGTKLDQEALVTAFTAGDWERVFQLVDDDVVLRHSASGTAEDVRQRFGRYNAVGLDEIVLAGQDDAQELETLMQTLRRIGAVSAA
jgi:5,10-methylenetetrahydromethanopterin reductase